MKKLFLLFMTACILLACEKAKVHHEKTVTVEIETIDNLAIVNGIYAAFAAGDIDSFLAALDNNVEWNEAENFPYDDGNPYIGPQAVLDGVVGRVGGEWDSFSVDNLKTYNMDNDMVLATGRYTGTYKNTGKSIDAQVAHLWTLKDGKVIKFQQYTDTKQVQDAISE